jgi:uncharacterized protein YndB with AHSA1/START domain
MRWLFNVMKAVLALLIVLAVVGWLLPDRRHVERAVEVHAAPAQVWPWIAEPRRWTAWSPWLMKDPQTALTYEGPVGGAGAGWHWRSASQGSGHMRFVAAEPPGMLRYELTFDDLGMPATGAFVLTPTADGTRVVWQMDAVLGRNPLARWFGLAMDSVVGADFETGLGRLATQVQAAPQP